MVLGSFGTIHEAKIAKYAGLYWRKHQSGRFTADDTSLSRNGNQYLHYNFVEAANLVRRHVPEYKEYYAKKFDEVPKHQHKKSPRLNCKKISAFGGCATAQKPNLHATKERQYMKHN